MAYKYNHCVQNWKIWGLVTYLTTNLRIWVLLKDVDF